jgi:hypothetical protein
VTVTIPDELATRLRAAARRGKTVDQLAVEALDELFPLDDPLEAFIGSGTSGRHGPLNISQMRSDAADGRRAEGL